MVRFFNNNVSSNPSPSILSSPSLSPSSPIARNAGAFAVFVFPLSNLSIRKKSPAMFDLGDELLIGSHRIPWLLWIQLVVMLLLIILLYYFAVFALGVDPSPSAVSPLQQPLSTATADNTIRLHKPQVGENSQPNKGDTGTSTSTRRVRREDVQERDGSTITKDSSFVLERSNHHPCSFLGFAKQAFLKCLGLDPPSEDSSSNTRQKKEE